MSLRPFALLLLATAPTAVAETHIIDVGGATLSFTPSQLTLTAGDTVTWINRGGVHNVHATSGSSFRCANGCDDTGGNGDPSGASWSFSRTFPSPGTINYECEPHGSLGMTGQLVIEPATAPGDPGQLRFANANINVQENVGVVNVFVRRIGGSDGAVSVSYETNDGSATAGLDYVATSGQLSWAAGDTADKSFAVTVLNDATPEGAETINLMISNPTGGASLASPSAATISILANDQPTSQPGTLAFSAATFHAHEEVAHAVVSVTRSGGSDGAVGVSWSAAEGSAVNGLDFAAATGSLSWGDGDGTAKTFMVEVLDDAVPEGNETVLLALSNPSGGATLGTPSVAELMIMDNDVESTGPCEPDAETLCLRANDRFRARVSWRTAQGDTGEGQAVPLEGRADSGLFYFFNPNNVEMLIKVLNGCPLNERYWVFFAATTNVEFTLTVTDTEAGISRTFVNPLNQAANAVTDTDAFATCP